MYVFEAGDLVTLTKNCYSDLNQTTWMFLGTTECVFHSSHGRKIRAVEIIGTHDCHDIHVLNMCM